MLLWGFHFPMHNLPKHIPLRSYVKSRGSLSSPSDIWCQLFDKLETAESDDDKQWCLLFFFIFVFFYFFWCFLERDLSHLDLDLLFLLHVSSASFWSDLALLLGSFKPLKKWISLFVHLINKVPFSPILKQILIVWFLFFWVKHNIDIQL